MKRRAIQYMFATAPLLLFSLGAMAQDAAGVQKDPYFFERMWTNVIVIVAGVVLLGAVAALVNLLNMMIKVQQIRIYQEQGVEAFLEEVKKPGESLWSRLYKRWTNVVPVEREEEIMFDHEYDGIRELDNVLPPWWVALFYITIGFGVIYMTYYHFSGAGPSSAEMYQEEMKKAEVAVQAYLETQANQVDENTVERLTDEGALAAGKTIFMTQCAVCHGTLGEGGVGPNMTDDYWLHGGTVKDLFRTIKYGVPEKGMISWKGQLRPTDMQNVASYILTLQGTNPPNAKEPQGVRLQVTTEPAPADTTATSEPIGMN